MIFFLPSKGKGWFAFQGDEDDVPLQEGLQWGVIGLEEPLNPLQWICVPQESSFSSVTQYLAWSPSCHPMESGVQNPVQMLAFWLLLSFIKSFVLHLGLLCLLPESMK